MTKPTSLPCALIASATERPLCDRPPEARKPRFQRTRRILLLALGLSLLFAATPGSANIKNYKWEDASGETVYRPTPPDDPDQPYCMREGDGGPWTCYTGAENFQEPPPDPSILTEAERQRRSDQLLTSRFRSIDAIDTARDDRLQQLELERRAVLRNLETQQQTLFGQIRAAADRQRAQLEVTADQLNDLARSRAILRSTEATLARMDQQETDIRRLHEEMKDRYRVLLQSNTSP